MCVCVCARRFDSVNVTPLLGLRETVNDEGVWRIRRRPRSQTIEVFRVEEVGHGDVLTDEFINWRIKLSLRDTES